jgi:hypothetical protein
MTSPTAEQMAELQKKLNPDRWIAHPPKDKWGENWGVELEDPDETAIGHYPLIEELKQSDHEAAAKFIAAARDFDFTTATANERRVRELEEESEHYRRCIRQAIESIKHQPKHSHKGSQVWSAVGWLFGLGSTSATKLCVEMGIEPNQTIGGSRG